MPINKSLQTGSTTMLILKLIEKKDMYGYQMIETLAEQSKNIFALKAGTLYPLLHGLEEQEFVSSYEKNVDTERIRKYYSITPKGKKQLKERQNEWNTFSAAVNLVLNGGAEFAAM